MASAREGSSLLRAVGRRHLGIRTPAQCRRAFASAAAEKPATNNSSDLAELDSASSFDTPAPGKEDLQAFKDAPKLSAKERNLPGNR